MELPGFRAPLIIAQPHRDLEILESLEATAIGERNPKTGKYDKGHPQLLMFLARTRLGMHEPKETKGDVADMRTPEEAHRAALVFLERMAKDSEPDGSACFTQAGTP